MSGAVPENNKFLLKVRILLNPKILTSCMLIFVFSFENVEQSNDYSDPTDYKQYDPSPHEPNGNYSKVYILKPCL